MPSYTTQMHTELDAPFPCQNYEVLSETFYFFIGAYYLRYSNDLFDAFPPTFTEIQRIAGVDIAHAPHPAARRAARPSGLARGGRVPGAPLPPAPRVLRRLRYAAGSVSRLG